MLFVWTAHFSPHWWHVLKMAMDFLFNTLVWKEIALYQILTIIRQIFMVSALDIHAPQKVDLNDIGGL